MEKFYMPSNIFVTYHAAQRYLERILELQPPISSRKVATARLFLTQILINRAIDVRGHRQDQVAYRLELAYKGILVVYEPKFNKVYSITPDEQCTEKRLKMEISIPMKFWLGKEVRKSFGKHTWRNFYNHKWPVIGRRAWALILDVRGTKIEVDYEKKTILLEPGLTKKFSFGSLNNSV